jgi:ferric-dicitrate binding protein FerR (iron transport regulator)
MDGTRRVLVGMLGVALAGTAARAQTSEAYGPDSVMASAQASANQAAVNGQQRVVRLTLVDGPVQVDAANNTGSIPAVLNMPLGEGTRLSTGEGAKAEIEFEDGSVVRLTPNSAVSLDALQVSSMGAISRISLLRGETYLELRAARESRFLVDAGGDQMSPTENAVLRVNMDARLDAMRPDLPTALIAVMSGAVRVSQPQGFAATVRSGQSLRADATDSRRYLLEEGITQEEWDGWNESRDLEAAQQAGARTAARDGYAGDQGYGWSDLDANGSWYDVPGQGPVWQPDAAAGLGAGFDPYGSGNWVGTGGGYVFASNYAWGWTPYRCGAWGFNNGIGWAWSPGSNCGAWGYGGAFYGDGFYGYGGGYRGPIRRPVRGPGRGSPILPVGGPVKGSGYVVGGGSGVATTRPPVFRGQELHRLPTVGGGYTPRGGSGVGLGLTRDFPVNRGTRQPVLGQAPTSAPATPAAGSGWRAVETRPGPTTGVHVGNGAMRQPGSVPSGLPTGLPTGLPQGVRTGVPQGMPTVRPGVVQAPHPQAAPPPPRMSMPPAPHMSAPAPAAHSAPAPHGK